MLYSLVPLIAALVAGAPAPAAAADETGAAIASEARVARALQYYGAQAIAPRDTANASEQIQVAPYLYNTAFDGVTWDARNWRLSSTVLDQGHYQSRGSIANGYIGINVASTGPFFEVDTPVAGDAINGWPLYSQRQSFAGLAGFWDQHSRVDEDEGSNFPWLNQYGQESFISGLPHWAGLVLDLGNGMYLDATVDNATISNYTTTYDYKAGVLSWHYTWSPEGYDGQFDIVYELFAHKLDVNQAVVRLSLEPTSDGNATIVNVFDGHSAVRTEFVDSGIDDNAMYTAVKPRGVANVTAYVYAMLEGTPALDMSSADVVSEKPYVHANDSSIAQAVPITFETAKPLVISKYVGIASTDAFSDPQHQAREAALAAKRSGFDNLLRTHVSEWAQVMPDDSVDDFSYKNGSLPADSNIIDDSIIAVVNPYYLLQNTVSENAMTKLSDAPVNDYSISVGGLTSDSYAGMIFWDAETWMQPGLVAAFPVSAQRIVNYRIAKYPQAKENVKTAFATSKNQTFFDDDAALYPWTSGRAGNCTGTGPCFDYQYHLNGDICIALLNQWITTGDNKTFEDVYFPLYNSVATAYGNLLERNGSSWTLTNMTDPDEYANHVDAGGFTMTQFAQILQYANQFRESYGMEQNETWNEMADNVLILRENNITLEYTTMNNSVAVKQADIVLNTFPLDYTENYTASDSLSDLDYYALKQSPDGPAMTWAIFSIVANEVSPSGCSAHTYARYSYSPYARAPFYQLSEQLIDNASVNGGTHPAYPFLTGHGGANQVAIYGYLGLRLLPDDMIHIDPNLPPQIPHIRYRTFYWRGWPITAESNATHTTVKRATDIAKLETAEKAYANTSIKLTVGQTSGGPVYTLPVNGSAIVVKNRKIGAVNTAVGNLVQCQPARSWDSFVPGQFPISVVDGAASTKWQPEFAANLSSVTVTLPPSGADTKITGFSFDWAQAPPVNATVIFHNTTISNPTLNLPLVPANNGTGALSSELTVDISSPWNPNASDYNEIHLLPGNSTNYTFSEPVPMSKFATLFIQGNQALDEIDVQYKNGSGATVAEWAILSNART